MKFRRGKEDAGGGSGNDLHELQAEEITGDVPRQPEVSFWKKIIPVMACGAGLFSDGYINNVSFCLVDLLAKIEKKN